MVVMIFCVLIFVSYNNLQASFQIKVIVIVNYNFINYVNALNFNFNLHSCILHYFISYISLHFLNDVVFYKAYSYY